ncbi:probable transcription factor At1g11510 [Durio zibethinus]|uniref:Probable transcription factor At1g11510 n=1 Tax=Durio zibethinus TaxID=66656 RepID=A0A6P5XXJ1_DURZI|nr:probable transcription factor At1g11510 [Durio zibethinus]
MAPKRSNPIDDPPAASSSEEEEEVTSSEEGDEDEEEGSSEEEEEEEEPKTQTTPTTQKSPPPKKPETFAPAIAVDESDESRSDSESESDTPTPNVKPIATKPMEETSNIKKTRSKPLASPVKASSTKRPIESEQEAKEAKRPKKKVEEEGTATTVVVEEVKKTGEDTKKQLFQRLFSEDDEIAVLKGMLDYSAQNESDPIADMNVFYDFVKKSIHTDVTKAQLMDKIRRLKKKFENNAGKGKKGEDRTFSKPHEQKAFKLSKMIWGEDGISGKVESSARSNGKAKANSKALTAVKVELPSSPEKNVERGEPMEVDKKSSKNLGSLFDKRFGVAGLEEELLKHGLDMVGGEKKATLEEKWRKLQIAELELFVQRTELVKEHAKLMLEFYKSENK